MADPIVLRYELTPEDYAEWMVFHSRRSAFHRRSLRNSIVWMSAISLGVLLLGGLDVVTIVLWMMLTAAWVAVLPRWNRWYTRRHVTRMAEQGLGRGCVGPHVLEVYDGGVSDRTQFSETRVLWGGMEEVVESPSQVLIYLGTHAALIIPKHAFPSDFAVGAFVEGMNDLIDVSAEHALLDPTGEASA